MTTALRRAGHGAGRAAVVLGAAGIGVAALTGTALAHVTITPGSAPQGSTAELTFKVPNEEQSAATVKLQLQVPTAHPIAQFLVKPVPGWTVTVQMVTLPKPIVTDDGSFTTAVSEVTWTGGKILPGQYQDFSVSADPLPSGIGQLVFKAVQTYSNGDVVRWIDLPQAGQPDPEHPAPALTLTTAAADADAAGGGSQAGSGADAVGSAASGSGADGSDTGALALGAAGLAAGLLGLAAGGSAWLRSRRSARASRSAQFSRS